MVAEGHAGLGHRAVQLGLQVPVEEHGVLVEVHLAPRSRQRDKRLGQGPHLDVCFAAVLGAPASRVNLESWTIACVQVVRRQRDEQPVEPHLPGDPIAVVRGTLARILLVPHEIFADVDLQP